MSTKPNFAQMSDAQLRQEMQRNYEKLIASLNEKIEAQHEIITRYEAADAWRSAVGKGETTLEQMQSAFDLEDAGEVLNPLPPGYIRNPEGRVVRVGQGDEVTETDTTSTPDDGFDVSQSFIGSVS